MRKVILSFLLTVPLLIGCGGSRIYSNYNAAFYDSLYQFSDEQIRRTYEAEPQITFPIKLSFYSPSKELKKIPDSLYNFEYISEVYKLPEALVEGTSYFNEVYYYDYYAPQVNISHLRQLAAQGKTDILVFCGTTIKEEIITNSWVWTYIFILPCFFMPTHTINITASADVFILDVRNNYLYSFQRIEEIYSEKGLSQFSANYKVRLKREELPEKLIPQVITYLEKELINPEHRKKE